MEAKTTQLSWEARQTQGLAQWYEDLTPVFDEWLKLETFRFHEPNRTQFFTGGRIVCKCGKDYQWKDWGYMPHATSRMCKHLRREHGVKRGGEFPLAWPFLRQWVDRWYEAEVA